MSSPLDVRGSTTYEANDSPLFSSPSLAHGEPLTLGHPCSEAGSARCSAETTKPLRLAARRRRRAGASRPARTRVARRARGARRARRGGPAVAIRRRTPARNSASCRNRGLAARSARSRSASALRGGTRESRTCVRRLVPSRPSLRDAEGARRPKRVTVRCVSRPSASGAAALPGRPPQMRSAMAKRPTKTTASVRMLLTR